MAEIMMRAFVLRSYGSADILELDEIERPVPADDEALVRVRATSVNPYDWHTMRGEPRIARLMGGTLGPRGPRIDILGADMAGDVEAVGRDVTEFGPGDPVFALLSGGGFAEYVCVKASQLAPKPTNLSYEQAAAVPMAACTALLGLRDVGRVDPGHRVLVFGASGGVGSFAVQIARALGAEVTGVCSTSKVDLVRRIGASEVVDYTVEDFTRTGRRYDLVLDVAGCSARACRRVLGRGGRFVLVGGPPGRWVQPAGHMIAAMVTRPLVPFRVGRADVVAVGDHKPYLRMLTELIEDEKVIPVIDRRYTFDEIPDAVWYQEQGHSPGKVVVTV